MSHKTDRLIQKARPKLSVVAPLTHKICLGFVWVNVALWALLSQTPSSGILKVPVPIVNNFLNYHVWGWWFLLLGVLMAIALATNRWKQLKWLLGIGLFSKILWAYALLYLIFHGFAVYATATLWGFLAWVQAWTIIHFIPPLTTPESSKNETEER